MKRLILLPGLLAVLSSPALAEVKSSSDIGFSVFHKAELAATPEEVWTRLIAPKLWWSKNHSWSKSVEGFSIDPRAGGCFCEAIQEKGADGKLKTVGTVEHMRVIYAHPGHALRMQGALGPLQSEAVLGTLTVLLDKAADGKGTVLSFSYVVGGYMRGPKVSSFAEGVDGVLGEQFKKLIEPWAGEEFVPVKGKLDLDVDALTGGDKETKDSADAPKADGTEEVTADAPPAEKPKPKTKLKLPDTVKPVTPGEGSEDR